MLSSLVQKSTPAFLSTWDKKTPILTPNRRLARYLCQYFKSEESLPILPLNDWLINTWRELKKPERLLTAFQEHILWGKIIDDSSHGEQMIKLGEQAWQLIHEWQIPLDLDIFNTTEETRFFQQCAEQFKSICVKENWITAAEITAHIQEAWNKGQIQQPKPIIYGFVDYSLAVRQLIAALKSEVIPPIGVKTAAVLKNECVSEEAEWRTAAHWALSAVKNNEQVGIVIPDLHQHRRAIQRIFSEICGESGFNISLGLSFAEYPLIEMALLLLQLGDKLQTNSLTLAELNKILHSPFIGEAEQEFCERAMLEEKFHTHHTRHISWQLWQKIAEQTELSCPHLHRRVRQLIGKDTHKKLPSDWANSFKNILNTMGWPGERRLSAAEYQQYLRWDELLEEFSELHVTSGALFFSEAVSLLHRLARQTIFQDSPKGEHAGDSAPVQILGLLEATGLIFDRLWVTGFIDEEWPASSRAHPFIPFSLQREKQLPHATPERALRDCESLVQHWCASGEKEVIFSWSHQVEGRTCGPSALIQSFPVATDLNPGVNRNQLIYDSKIIEEWQEETPPLGGRGASTGGTGILKEQAACPFKAFAMYRLKAKNVGEPQAGLTKAERGSIVHEILHRVWRRLKTQAALLALTDKELEELLTGEITVALQPRLGSDSRYFGLEKNCLLSLLQDWLAVEKKRPPFEVLSTEQLQKLQIGQLELSVRSDRIDKLEDGRCLVIDYKTGINSIADWFGERPNEPQLPLYSVHSEHPVSGIAFVSLKPDELKFKGISAKDINISGVKSIEQWDGLMNAWREALQSLATEFEQGVATITPKDDTACERCHLGSLCRVREITG